MGVNRCWTKF